MKSIVPLVLGVTGAILICFGSVFVIAAPGDGQTGMFAFPLWVVGACVGLVAIVMAIRERTSLGISLCIAALALISIGSVVWGFVASNQYESDWERKHDSSKQAP